MQRLAITAPRRAPGQRHSNEGTSRRCWDMRLGCMKDSFAIAEVPTPQEDACDSLSSVARLSGPLPDPWLCVPASQRVCHYREEGLKVGFDHHVGRLWPLRMLSESRNFW